MGIENIDFIKSPKSELSDSKTCGKCGRQVSSVDKGGGRIDWIHATGYFNCDGRTSVNSE